MHLTDREKEELKRLLDAGELLPAKYKLRLFADAPEVELMWQGKTSEVTSVVLPFQSIEQIDEPRRAADDYTEVWTGNSIFENEWQSFGSKKDQSLELTSAEREYPKKGRYHTAVKVIDSFGNDTTKVVEACVWKRSGQYLPTFLESQRDSASKPRVARTSYPG